MEKQKLPVASLQQLMGSSYLGSNAAYIETLYDNYLSDPSQVDGEWRNYFDSLADGHTALKDISHSEIREQFRQLARRPKAVAAASPGEQSIAKQIKVDALIEAYQRFGHLNAKLDPLGSENPIDQRLTLAHHQLSDADLSSEFATRGILNRPQASLKEVLAQLRQCYCSTIGVEYRHIDDAQEREWLCQQVEQGQITSAFTGDQQRDILQALTAAEGLEKYLDSRYPGQKRFSIEGGDSLIPMLHQLAHNARAVNVHELVIGMAHRGRLNVLLNIFGQSPKELFQEFDGTAEYGLTTGDVKYHRGYSSDISTDSGPMHLTLGFNPSHLEFISPVVLGSVRARQQKIKQGGDRDYAMSVLIHGDGAFIGQGVVLETLSMSQTRAYHVGGSIHIVLNNQVGFTTSHAHDARSSHYCSDIAKVIDAPVFHVNGDDPQAAVAVMNLALAYRMKFHKDVVIDLVCYRRHGHQEADEPRATQPLMYKMIEKHPTTRELYAQQLIKQGVCSQADVDQWSTQYRDKLDQGRQCVEVLREALSDHYAANWTPFIGSSWKDKVDTSVSKKRLLALGKRLDKLPDGFELQRNVAMIYQARSQMTAEKQPLDWGYAEIMAYATLLEEGYGIRFSGEDVGRGTFFHRHATLHDQQTGDTYTPLAHVSDKQAIMQIYDSLLAETGPLGFEYGYSTADPSALVIWEAQFGDFANVAQVIIDQFISSGWQKWNRLSGLVMLLPHGYEGMGPEHSSARLERYLQLCAQENIQVFVPTTPSQIFHLLRRQVLRPFRKPLIVMSPKSLLRHKMAVSSLEDLSKGQLQLVIPEVDELAEDKVTRIILCCGKVYYELLAKRREHQLNHIAIIRIEQLYPFPYDELSQQIQRYDNANDVIWCQEEPKNQGAWFCSRHRFLHCMTEHHQLSYVGRRSFAAPAAGYPALHKKQQIDLVNQALDLAEQ